MNPTQKGKIYHYTPVLYGQMNRRIYKAKLHTLRILLDSRAIYYILLGKHNQTPCNKTTNPVKWSNKGGNLKKLHDHCWIHTPRIGCDEKCDVELSCGQLAGKLKVQYDSGSRCFIWTQAYVSPTTSSGETEAPTKDVWH